MKMRKAIKCLKNGKFSLCVPRERGKSEENRTPDTRFPAHFLIFTTVKLTCPNV